MFNAFAPFRLLTVADLDMVLQMGLKSRLKREKMRRLNGDVSEPVKWTRGNNPSGQNRGPSPGCLGGNVL